MRKAEPETKEVEAVNIKVGDVVAFDDRNQVTIQGKIIRVNQKTATIVNERGTWRVSFGILRRVREV